MSDEDGGRHRSGGGGGQHHNRTGSFVPPPPPPPPLTSPLPPLAEEQGRIKIKPSSASRQESNDDDSSSTSSSLDDEERQAFAAAAAAATATDNGGGGGRTRVSIYNGSEPMVCLTPGSPGKGPRGRKTTKRFDSAETPTGVQSDAAAAALEAASAAAALNPPPTPISFGKLTPQSTRSVLLDDATQLRRLVAVRYYLDRPGYGLHNSAMRLWFDPPESCRPCDVHKFLNHQGIAFSDSLLIEVYLDKFRSFMLLEACDAACIEWDFSDVSLTSPGVLNIRLTDTELADKMDSLEFGADPSGHLGLPGGNGGGLPFPPPAAQAPVAAGPRELANTTPIAVFAFSFMNGLEAAVQMGILIPGFLDQSTFALAWGPYMVSMGLLQVIAACFQVLRNNIYGAVAFLGFGGIWFANGLRSILSVYFAPDDIAEYGLDYAGDCIRSLFVLAFSMVLLLQTFRINKLSTSVITLLCLKLLFMAFSGWSVGVRWIYMVLSWLTSFMAFYVFMVEMTNSVYHREVFHIFKWSEKESPEEMFGAPGKSMTLYSKAAKLRSARYPRIHHVRSAMASVNARKNKTE